LLYELYELPFMPFYAFRRSPILFRIFFYLWLQLTCNKREVHRLSLRVLKSQKV